MHRALLSAQKKINKLVSSVMVEKTAGGMDIDMDIDVDDVANKKPKLEDSCNNNNSSSSSGGDSDGISTVDIRELENHYIERMCTLQYEEAPVLNGYHYKT